MTGWKREVGFFLVTLSGVFCASVVDDFEGRCWALAAVGFVLAVASGIAGRVMIGGDDA